MKALLRFFRLPLMALGIAIELMLIPIAWVVRFVEEHTDEEATMACGGKKNGVKKPPKK